jgi:hypothetical protein
MRGVLTPTIELKIFGNLEGLPSPHFRSVNVILTLPKVGLRHELFYFEWHPSQIATLVPTQERIKKV